jgi:hypothetical protein
VTLGIDVLGRILVVHGTASGAVRRSSDAAATAGCPTRCRPTDLCFSCRDPASEPTPDSSKRWRRASTGVPERQNLHDRRIRSYAVVEVVPDTSEKNATNAREAGIPSDRADFGMGSEYLERSGEFLTESRGCGGPVLGHHAKAARMSG